MVHIKRLAARNGDVMFSLFKCQRCEGSLGRFTYSMNKQWILTEGASVRCPNCDFHYYTPAWLSVLLLVFFLGGVLVINKFILELGLWVCVPLVLVIYLMSSLAPLKSIAKSFRSNQ